MTVGQTSVIKHLEQHIEDRDYDIRCLGYDPYNAQDFLQRYEVDYGGMFIQKVIQGAKTESVPLGELKILAEQRQLIFDEEIMCFTMGNSITL